MVKSPIDFIGSQSAIGVNRRVPIFCPCPTRTLIPLGQWVPQKCWVFSMVQLYRIWGQWKNLFLLLCSIVAETFTEWKLKYECLGQTTPCSPGFTRGYHISSSSPWQQDSQSPRSLGWIYSFHATAESQKDLLMLIISPSWALLWYCQTSKIKVWGTWSVLYSSSFTALLLNNMWCHSSLKHSASCCVSWTLKKIESKSGKLARLRSASAFCALRKGWRW